MVEFAKLRSKFVLNGRRIEHAKKALQMRSVKNTMKKNGIK
jgi:hypothetical protein